MNMNNSTIKQLQKYAPDFIMYAAVIGAPFVVFLLIQNYQQQLQMLMLDDYRRQALFSSVATTFQDFMTLTFGIIVEALPFVILGVLFSVFIQTVLPTERLVKKLPKNRVLRRILVSFLGVAMPVCECGNIPVARSLMVKGFSTQEAIVFLLAAPSINIITFVVTWEAFNFNHSVAIARVFATLLVANITALLVAKLVSNNKLLTKDFQAACEISSDAPRSISRSAELFRNEMWLITRLLIVGAMIAAASQTFIPRDVITAIADNVVLSVVAMLILAFVISICSSVDAFFALAYVNTFSLGSILAFLVAGPMVDIKMIAMMQTTFSYRTLAVITSSVFIFSLMLGVIFTYVW
jgi:uncharacterized protein